MDGWMDEQMNDSKGEIIPRKSTLATQVTQVVRA